MNARGEHGYAGGLESLVFGMLVFIGGSVLLATGWSVIDTTLATQAAARETARAWVESDGSEAAWGMAVGRGREAFEGHGRSADVLIVRRLVDRFERCVPVTIEASARVSVPGLPLEGRPARQVRVVGRHTEVVDPYRSGLPRGTGCVR